MAPSAEMVAMQRQALADAVSLDAFLAQAAVLGTEVVTAERKVRPAEAVEIRVRDDVF